MEGLDEIGFDVGWDHAMHGVPVPEHLMLGTLADGFRAGTEKRGRARPKEADRYVRKWLQLRRNAWRRERIFDAGVTPEFIRRIDVPYCPITRERLTYSTGEETDWSVDRLVNDGGYARGNLVVMSTRANKAKDSTTTRDIVDRAANYDEEQKAFFLSDKPLPGLTTEQTMRLYTLTMLPHAGDIMLAAKVFAPPAVPVGQVYIFQCYLAMLALLGTVRNGVKADLKRLEPGMGGIHKVIRKITDAGRSPLLARARERAAATGILSARGGIPLQFDDLMWTAEDVWSPTTGVYEELHKWIWSVSAERFTSVIKSVLKLASSSHVGAPLDNASRVDPESLAKRIGIETGGYVREG